MSTKKTLTLFMPLMSSSLRRNARGQSLSAVPNHRCRRWMNTHELFLPSLFAAHEIIPPAHKGRRRFTMKFGTP